MTEKKDKEVLDEDKKPDVPKKRKRTHPSEKLKKAAEGCGDLRKLLSGEGTSSTTSFNDRKRRKNGFRLQGKNLYLTFPQCETSKEKVFQNLKDLKYEGQSELWKFIIVGAEKHKDGNPHLHVVIQAWNKFTTRKADFFDQIAGKHGNYQSVRNLKKVVQYCIKDGDYISEGIDVTEFMKQGRTGVFATAADHLQKGGSIRTLDQGLVIQHLKKLQDYASFLKMDDKTEKLPWYGISTENLQGADYEIGQWLNENIKVQRAFKQPQLFIYGPKNMGKTTLIETLERYLRIYHIPPGEEFYDFYEDGLYDLAVIDEFKGQKMIQWLNEWLQGSTMCIRKKGRQEIKRQNIPTIMLSNFPLKGCYSALLENRLDTLETRLTMIQVESFINVDFNDTEVSTEEIPGSPAPAADPDLTQLPGSPDARNAPQNLPGSPARAMTTDQIFDEGRQILVETGIAEDDTSAEKLMRT